MKTAFEIWVKVCNENDLGYSDCAIIAMKEYASEAIDKLVEEYQRGDDFDIKIYAEKIKSELK